MLAAAAAAAAKLLQSCPPLCDPIDGLPPGFPVPGILQAGTLEWVAISFSNAWKWKVKVKSLSGVRLFVTRGLQPTRLLRPWDFPGKSTGVGWLSVKYFCSSSPIEQRFHARRSKSRRGGSTVPTQRPGLSGRSGRSSWLQFQSRSAEALLGRREILNKQLCSV